MMKFNDFLKGINPIVSVIAWTEFEHICYDVASQYFSHDVTGNPFSGEVLVI